MARLARLLLTGILAFGLGGGPALAAQSDPVSAPSVEKDTAEALVAENGANYVLVLLDQSPSHLRSSGGYSDSYGDGVGRNTRRKFAESLAKANGLSLVEGWPMPLVGVDCFVLKVPEGRSPQDVATALSHVPGVSWSEPMNIFNALGAAQLPDDPLFAAQPAAKAWRLADLHQLATGRSVRVAVVDSMVDVSHPDLIGQVQSNQNFVTGHGSSPEQHGTGIAGVIAASSDNQMGIVGVAPEARIMALRACWQKPSIAGKAGATVCDSLGLAKAINYAIVNKAQVINLSLSGPPDPLLARLLDVAMERGITIVSAYDRSLPSGGFPAAYPGVVAVSDRGPSPSSSAFVAPGRDIPTTQVDGHWYFVNGSSYSAAHVSGLFALLREHSPAMRSSSALVAARPGGEIDVCATLMRVTSPCDCACAHKQALSISSH